MLRFPHTRTETVFLLTVQAFNLLVPVQLLPFLHLRRLPIGPFKGKTKQDSYLRSLEHRLWLQLRRMTSKQASEQVRTWSQKETVLLTQR